MLNRSKYFVSCLTTLLIVLIAFTRCAVNNPPVKIETSGTYFSKKQLTRQFFTKYHVDDEHIRSLQYYINKEIILHKGSSQYYYGYEDHGLDIRDTHTNELIKFHYRLAGRLYDIRYEKRWVPPCGKPRMVLLIYFDQAGAYLEFREHRRGYFELLVDRKKRTNFGGQIAKCIVGDDARLEIDVHKLGDIYDNDVRVIEGAPYYIGESNGPSRDSQLPWGFLIGLGILILFALNYD